MRDHFVRRLTRLAENDPSVFLITGDLGFGVFDDYRATVPDQFLNIGVAEQNMIGVATGMALEGFKVFTYSIANFATLRCLEQIRNDACYHQANVNVVSIGAGFSYGPLGVSHHATEDLSILRSLPDITVVSPCELWEVMEATEALIEIPGATYLRLDKSHARETKKADEKFVLGKIRTVRDGNDVSFFATGGILEEALVAAECLEKENISVRVHSVHTLKPFDIETVICAVDETRNIVTIEEHTVDGGLGGVIAENLLELGHIPRTFHRVGLRGGFASSVGSQKFLRQYYKMDVVSICEQVKKMILKPTDELQ